MSRTIEDVIKQSKERNIRWRAKKENNTPVICDTCNKTLKNIFTYKNHCKGKKHNILLEKSIMEKK